VVAELEEITAAEVALVEWFYLQAQFQFPGLQLIHWLLVEVEPEELITAAKDVQVQIQQVFV
jgi:hypothetical protein